MKGCWDTDPAGGAYWPDWVKLRANKVTRLYFPTMLYDPSTRRFTIPNARQFSPAYRNGVISQGFEFAGYDDPAWGGAGSPQLLVDRLLKAITDAGGAHSVMFDIEFHDAHFVAETIRLWREKKPTGPISWTLEPHQGGWFTKELVDRVNKDPNCVVVPQNFYGDMTPYDASPYTTLRGDLTSRGIAENRVKVFYDGSKTIPANWDGCILSLQSLP